MGEVDLEESEARPVVLVAHLTYRAGEWREPYSDVRESQTTRESFLIFLTSTGAATVE